jgi:hypothetical protein
MLAGLLIGNLFGAKETQLKRIGHVIDNFTEVSRAFYVLHSEAHRYEPLI